MRPHLAVLLVTLAVPGLDAANLLRPSLQWYQTVSGTGASSATSVSTDPQGNLYIVGNTLSLDLPTISAAQKQPGGSPLMRIDSSTGASVKLYSGLLSAASSLAVDPQNPLTLYAGSGGTL